MTSFIVPAGAGEDALSDDARLHLAAAAYLARFKGLSREHTDSDLRTFPDRNTRPHGAPIAPRLTQIVNGLKRPDMADVRTIRSIVWGSWFA